jgi:hypothetical protein
MELWRVYRPEIEDSHHMEEELDTDPEPHQSEKLDPDPNPH